MSATELHELHLADLHRLAAEHGVGGYRLLRRGDLIRALQETDTDELTIIGGGGETADEPASRSAAVRERRTEPGPRSRTAPRGRERIATGGGRPPRERAEREEAPTEPVTGIVELTRQRYGFLRMSGLGPGDEDVYISAAQVRRCELRPGDQVSGPARAPRRGERHRALVHVDSVNGGEPEDALGRPEFEALAPVPVERRIGLDAAADDVLVRATDLLAPLGFGQRVLVGAAPRSGRTTLLRGIAGAAAGAGAQVIVLLVDERPEEASGWREAVPGAEFAIATADLATAEQLRIAELALDRARRLAEAGADVVLVCDSLSRLGFAAGDVDAVKRLFGSGRDLAEGGSLTVVATVLAGGADESEAERAVTTTESSLVTLDPKLAGAGVYPALAVTECQVSGEEKLRDPDELEAARRLRVLLADLDPREAADLLRERIESSASNAELLSSL